MSVCCVRKVPNVHFPTFRLSYFMRRIAAAAITRPYPEIRLH